MMSSQLRPSSAVHLFGGSPWLRRARQSGLLSSTGRAAHHRVSPVRQWHQPFASTCVVVPAALRRGLHHRPRRRQTLQDVHPSRRGHAKAKISSRISMHSRNARPFCPVANRASSTDPCGRWSRRSSRSAPFVTMPAIRSAGLAGGVGGLRGLGWFAWLMRGIVSTS